MCVGQAEAGRANQRHILFRRLLDMHRVSEQPPDEPGVDIGFGGFREQKATAWFQDAHEFAGGILLVDDVVECLVAEHHVDAARGQPRCRCAGSDNFGLARGRLHGRGGPGARTRIGVQADDPFGREPLRQISERATVSATHVQDGLYTCRNV